MVIFFKIHSFPPPSLPIQTLLFTTMNKPLHIFKSTFARLQFSLSRAMLCFISCFRTSHSHSSHECGDSQYCDYESDKEIRDEAKFLKSCGTLVETPIEIRKASEKLTEDSAFSQFHSWLPINALQFDAEVDHSPTSLHLFHQHTPMSCKSKTHESVLNGEDDAENYASVIEVDADNADGITTPFTPWPSASNIQSRNKSVRFECDFATSAVEGSSKENFHCEISKKLESPWQPIVSKYTPKPTPLKLTDEMQTPGTVFPNNAESCANGKARIRSQYVYSVSNPKDLCLPVAETN